MCLQAFSIMLYGAYKLGFQQVTSSWCFYLLLVADYNILDADMYTLHAVTIFIFHISTLMLILVIF